MPVFLCFARIFLFRLHGTYEIVSLFFSLVSLDFLGSFVRAPLILCQISQRSFMRIAKHLDRHFAADAASSDPSKPGQKVVLRIFRCVHSCSRHIADRY